MHFSKIRTGSCELERRSHWVNENIRRLDDVHVGGRWQRKEDHKIDSYCGVIGSYGGGIHESNATKK